VSKLRRSRRGSALVGGAVFAFATVIVIRAVDGDVLYTGWRAMLEEPVELFFVIAAFGVAFLLRAFAWCRVLPGLKFSHSLAGIHLALGANHVLPMRLGEPLRIVSVVRRTKVRFDAVASSTVTLRAVDICTVLGIGVLVAPGTFVNIAGIWGLPIFLAVVGVGLVGFRWLRQVSRVDPTAVRYPGILVIVLTASAWLAESVVVWQCARWAGMNVSPQGALLVATVAVSAQVVAIAPSGFGTYEAASVAAYAALGHDTGTALAAALTAHGLKTGYSLLAGGIAVLKPRPGLAGRLRLAQGFRSVPGSAQIADDAPVLLFMPALNEEDSVGACVRRVPETVCGRRVEVLVVDDGSSDRTAEIARRCGAKVESFGVCRGLGAGVRFGLEYGVEQGAAVIAFCDADEEYPPEELERLVAPVLFGDADYVVGSRFAGTIEHMRPHRRFGNLVLTKILSFIARTPITDGQSGYRALSFAAAADAEVIHDFNYAQVLTLDLIAKGYRYREVPISYRFRTSGESFVRLGGYLRRVVPAVYREVNAA